MIGGSLISFSIKPEDQVVMFEGSTVALITPFTRSGKVDTVTLRRLTRFHIERGTDGILVSGTTGESPSLSGREYKEVVETVIEECDGRIPVIAGCGTNSPWKGVELTGEAQRLGASGGLSVCPYYNKPTQEGLYRHFMEIAEVGLPIMLYNIPGRTSVNLLPETVRRLSEHENIVAIKEASGDLDQIQEICRLTENELTLLSGDDGLTLDVLCHGGKGVVSVTANLLPSKVKAVVFKSLSGDSGGARDLHHHLLPLHGAMFIETNPIPVREALELAGWDVGKPRLPLTTMTRHGKNRLKEVLSMYSHEIESEHSAILRGSKKRGRKADR
jgi:4-hydroxy-tetrahydrodipicolinate synthase